MSFVRTIKINNLLSEKIISTITYYNSCVNTKKQTKKNTYSLVVRRWGGGEVGGLPFFNFFPTLNTYYVPGKLPFFLLIMHPLNFAFSRKRQN